MIFAQPRYSICHQPGLAFTTTLGKVVRQIFGLGICLFSVGANADPIDQLRSTCTALGAPPGSPNHYQCMRELYDRQSAATQQEGAANSANEAYEGAVRECKSKRTNWVMEGIVQSPNPLNASIANPYSQKYASDMVTKCIQQAAERYLGVAPKPSNRTECRWENQGIYGQKFICEQ